MISYSVDRSSLSLGALVIPAYPVDGLWAPEEEQGRPAKVWRRATASAPFIHGSVQTAAALDTASFPLAVYVQKTSAAALEAAKDEVEEAFFQFTFDLTRTENGVSRVWAAYCADVSWGDFDSGMVRAFMAKATITVPVYPVAS